MVKVSEFIIGMIGISMIIGIMGLFMVSVNTNYGTNLDNDSIANYNQLAELEELSQDINTKADIEEKSGVLDIIGNYFTGAYNVLKITKLSLNNVDTMTNQAIEQSNLGAVGGILRVGITSIILILIVVGVLISAIVKKDL